MQIDGEEFQFEVVQAASLEQALAGAGNPVEASAGGQDKGAGTKKSEDVGDLVKSLFSTLKQNNESLLTIDSDVLRPVSSVPDAPTTAVELEDDNTAGESEVDATVRKLFSQLQSAGRSIADVDFSQAEASSLTEADIGEVTLAGAPSGAANAGESLEDLARQLCAQVNASDIIEATPVEGKKSIFTEPVEW